MKRSSLIAAVAIVGSLSAGVLPQQASAEAVDTGLKGIVRIRVVSNSGGETPRRSNQTVWYDFLPGESKSFMATAGHAGDLCRTGAAGPLPFTGAEFQAWAAKEEASAQYVWHFDVHMIEVKASSITFELSWQRTSRASSDEQLRYSQRLILRQGDARPIDLLHGTSGSPCSDVTIFAESDITDDPALVGKMIEWDLWATTGPKTTSRQKLRSVQGEAADFRFEPLAEPGSEPDEWAVFYGTVTGRVRLDGTIDVAIDARQLRTPRIMSPIELTAMFKKFQERGADPLSIGKNYTAKPGEAVKIVVPASLTRRTAKGFESVPPVYPMSITVRAQVR